jgi:hypothetical protein
MLISHPCRFIYLKTRKTAGTSVEIYLEPYCVDPKSYVGELHGRDQVESEWGVVGARARTNAKWYNHMAAARVRELVSSEIWECYWKFCVVRNPFDKVVSYFWHKLAPELREALGKRDFADARKIFAAWTELRQFPNDAFIYTIDGAPAVDDFLRYERLESDMATLCARLKIPWQPNRMGRYKSDWRKRSEAFEEYYTAEAAERVAEAFAWELEYFGYPRVG